MTCGVCKNDTCCCAAAESLTNLAYACAEVGHALHLAHFNVVGPTFSPLHALYETGYEFLGKWYDRFAERVRALGVPFAARLIDLPEGVELGELAPYDGVVLALLDELASLTHVVFEEHEEADEDTTANLILDFVAKLDKLRWQIRSTVTSVHHGSK